MNQLDRKIVIDLLKLMVDSGSITKIGEEITYLGENCEKYEEEKYIFQLEEDTARKAGWYRYDMYYEIPVYNENEEVERRDAVCVIMIVRHTEDGKKYLYDITEIKKYEENRTNQEFEYEINLSKEDYEAGEYEVYAEWGAAYGWYGEIGVEYEINISHEENSSAMYLMIYNEQEENYDTISYIYEHYEIDFTSETWEEDLAEAMRRFLLKCRLNDLKEF